MKIKTRAGDEKGLFLLQAMIMIMILAIIAGYIMQILMGRQGIAAKEKTGQVHLQNSRDANSQADNILAGSNLGAPGTVCDCNPTWGSGGCAAATTYSAPATAPALTNAQWNQLSGIAVNGSSPTWVISGTPPNCSIQFTIN